MEKQEIKYCRFCGKELQKVDGEYVCSNNLHTKLLKIPNDKIGVFAYLVHNHLDELKDHVLDEVSKLSKTYFLSKLLSYIVVATIAVGAATTTVSVVNKINNDKLLETGELPNEKITINTYDYSLVLEEPNEIVVENTQGDAEIIEEEIVEETNEEINEEIENKEVKEDEQLNKTSGWEVDDNLGPRQRIFELYHQYLMGYIEDTSFFANGPLTSGSLPSYDKCDDDLIGLVRVEVGDNYLFLSHEIKNLDQLQDDDVFFGKLTFEIIDGEYKLVSDEPINMTFKQIVDQYE